MFLHSSPILSIPLQSLLRAINEFGVPAVKEEILSQTSALGEAINHTYQTRTCISDGCGYNYAFCLTERSMTIWDARGAVALGTYYFQDNYTLSRDMTKSLYRAIELYRFGKMACSNCRTVIEIDTAPSYYAGHYCQSCWDNEIAEIASKDNHD